jgi:MFS transporter, DHA1 family, multidrug resistance protein
MNFTLKTTHRNFVPLVSVILALLTTMSPFAIDTYLSAMPEMAKAFNVRINLVQMTVTLYFLGFALGNFLGGPLSDSFGRKRIAIIGIFLYGASAALIPAAPKIGYVWILRFFQAFGGGFGTVTAMVFVKDWFEGKQVARMASIIGMIMMLAPLFAPIIGSLLVEKYEWPGIFYFLSLFALLLFVLIGLVLPESRQKELLTKRLTTKQLFSKYVPFFKSKKAVFMLLTISFSSAGLFTFITSASFMYITYYNFEAKLFPYLFAANIILQIILSLLNTVFLKKYEPESLLSIGIIMQLTAGIVLGVTVLISGAPSFKIVFPAIVLFIGSLGLIFGNGNAIILNLLPKISGSANATIGVSRFIFSFIAGSIPALFHTDTLTPIGITMFGSTFIASVFTYLFYNTHKKI